jgi:hypothetical protein
MNTGLIHAPAHAGSLGTLLHPRGLQRPFAAALAGGLLVGWLAVSRLSLPLWAAALVVVVLLLLPAARKWHADRRALGTPAMVLGILLVTQSLHTVEHLTQWVQYHLLGWSLKASSGIISPLNAEIVHFSWNVGVLLVVVYLVAQRRQPGMRNLWMGLLLIWAAAHTAEHTYMFVRYLGVAQRLAEAGLPTAAAQGLPGFFGQGGWLANNLPGGGPVAWLCSVAPGLTGAPRLDVHFWWNAGEIVLLLAAAHVSMGRRPAP